MLDQLNAGPLANLGGKRVREDNEKKEYTFALVGAE